MAAWLDALHTLSARDEPLVLLTVIRTQGSAPREAGTKMVVSASEVWDTIGGGNLEYQSIQDARALLTSGETAPRVRDFPLGPALGQCCGGATTVLFEPIRPPGWTVALFGAGHVGRAVTRLLADLPCGLLWFDAREGAFDTGPVPANARARASSSTADIAALPAASMVLIMTHDHALDFTLTQAALARPDLGFIGTIGSDTKRARFTSRLRRAGLPEDALTRLRCPVGLAGVGGKLPAEIAIAVVAQLLASRGEQAGASAPLHRVVETIHESCGAPGCEAACGRA